MITAAARQGKEKAMSQPRPRQQEKLVKHFIALPGRLQTQGYCRPAEAFSSASSAVSELDDADKEVRSLTARTFRSLAYPYFDMLHFSSSESSSLSEQQRCSSTITLMDWKASKERATLQQAGAQGNYRLVKPPGNSAVSACSRNEATERVSRDAAEGMEEPEKKSQLASSLLKSVISKKMQLEQEFRMERGQIRDTSQTSPGGSAPAKVLEGFSHKGLQRQNSCYSEASSDHTIAASDDLEELFNAKLPPSRKYAQQSTAEAAKGLLLRSQNSAFRSWHAREQERVDQAGPQVTRMKDWRANLGELSMGQSTKMSCLFVPSIQQHAPKDKQLEKQATKCSAASVYVHQSCFSHCEEAVQPSAQVTSWVPDIQVTTRASPEAKNQTFNITKLLTPNLAPNLPGFARAPEDTGREPSKDEKKLPQFHIRDVRESKPKTLGTIHQVRDVRKLIKSSQQPGTAESSTATASEQNCSKTKLALANIPNSLSPVRITCQAVRNQQEKLGAHRVHGLSTAKSQPLDTVLVHRTSGRLPVATIAPNKSCPRLPVVKIMSKASAWKLDKPKEPEAKEEPSALDRLTAAVKSMEELYTFEQHEWKRKGEPLPVTESHMLSALTSQGKEEEERAIRVRGAPGLACTPEHCNSSPNATRFQQTKSAPGLGFHEQEERGNQFRRTLRTPVRELTSTSTTKSLFTFSSTQQAPDAANSSVQPSPSPATSAKPSVPTAAPAQEHKEREQNSAETSPVSPRNQSGVTDYGNYLTIPLKGGGSPQKEQSRRAAERSIPPPPLLPPPPPTATTYQPSPLPLLFLPPLVPAAMPDLVQPQRKMLLDLSTGQCYVLEAPKRKLYDPKSSQYVEVPVSPAPLPVSPLALSPGAYGPTYMLFPGFLPAAPLFPASTLFSEAGYEVSEVEKPYFLATGKPTATSTATTSLGGKARVPSQGPHLVAAPSFDGTTMRFVVEHR